MIPRRLLLAAGLLLLAAAPLHAKPGTLRTAEGQVYEGDITDKPGDDFVTVDVRGIKTQIPRNTISTITDTQSIDDEYKARLAKLDPKDAKGRMDLARWLFSQKRYDLARDAADKALAVDPNSADATQFLVLVQSQQRMERARDARPATTEPAAAAGDGGPPATRATDRVDWKLLSADDINRIRQEELRKTDSRVRFRFRNDVERKHLVATRDYTYADWNALTPLQRAIDILDRGDPQVRNDVVVLSEPAAILDYRRIVQPLLLASCSTVGCHGGLSAGSLVLNTTADTSEPATYTNFYILSRYAKKVRTAGDQQAVFGGEIQRRMIDRTHPEDSLLLQYGLPRNVARSPHPDVPNFRAAFPRGKQDTKYQAIANWIGQTLAPIEPNYGINYDPPTGTSAATAPATNPATHPTRRR